MTKNNIWEGMLPACGIFALSKHRRVSIFCEIFAFIFIVGSLSSSADNYFGENFLPAFDTPEEWKPVLSEGGTCSLDEKIKIGTKPSFHLEAQKSGSGSTISSSMLKVQAGKIYLISLAYRSRGFGKSGYSGTSAHMRIVWYDQQNKPIALDASLTVVGFPYRDVDWTISDRFSMAPTNAAFVQWSAGLSNQSASQGSERAADLWLASPQIRLYNPPKTPKWALGKTTLIVEGGMSNDKMMSYFFTHAEMRGGGKGSENVIDRDAERGTALKAIAGSGKNMIAEGPYETSWKIGLYRARLRVKLLSSKAKGQIGAVDVNSGNYGVRMSTVFNANDFKRTGKYIVLEKDFIIRGTGYNNVRLYSEGKFPWQIDWCKIVPLAQLNDKLLQDIYPGIMGSIPKDLQPRKKSPTKVLVFSGLGFDRWGIAKTIRLSDLNTEIKMIWVNKSGHGKWTFENLPKTNKVLFDHNFMMMVNINLNQMPLKLKNAIREYVKRGGLIVVFGGDQSFERGNWAGSLLEDLLPVTVEKDWKSGVISNDEGFELSLNKIVDGDLDFKSKPKALILHLAKPKPGSKILMKAGKYPFLVMGKYDKGHVICVLAWPFGTLKGSGTPFWEWGDWPYLLRNSIWKAMDVNLAAYRYVDRCSEKYLQASRPEQRPSATNRWATCLLCPGLTTFFLGPPAGSPCPGPGRPRYASVARSLPLAPSAVWPV